MYVVGARVVIHTWCHWNSLNQKCTLRWHYFEQSLKTILYHSIASCLFSVLFIFIFILAFKFTCIFIFKFYIWQFICRSKVNYKRFRKLRFRIRKRKKLHTHKKNYKNCTAYFMPWRIPPKFKTHNLHTVANQ